MPYDQFMIDLRTPAFTDAPVENAMGTGRFPLGTGSYTITAGSLITRGTGFRGSYRIAAFDLSDGTELAPASIAIGDTVTTDLSPLGDVDRFTLAGTQGDSLNLMFQGLAAPSSGGFQAAVLDSAGTILFGLGSGTSTAALSDHQTGYHHLPYTGTFIVWVATGNNGSHASEQGGYRIALVP